MSYIYYYIMVGNLQRCEWIKRIILLYIIVLWSREQITI